MLCPTCQKPASRFGKDRKGNQRFLCKPCGKTFSEPRTRLLDSMRLPLDRAVTCLRQLLEGSSIRSTERITGVHRDTIMDLLVTAGRCCQRFLDQTLVNLPVEDIQVDEIWGFVGCKEKTRVRCGYAEVFGDAYCFTAIERNTKLMVAWHLGKRSPEDTLIFAEKLHRATAGRFQLSTDGFTPYRTAIPSTFNGRVDFAQLVKVYGNPPRDDTRYSPGVVVSTSKQPQSGNPDPAKICTSHVERSNLTIRMTVRRLTRLTNAFSKKWENHEAALALFFAYYNFCRIHMTLKETPAMKADLAFRVWSVQELLERAAESSKYQS